MISTEYIIIDDIVTLTLSSAIQNTMSWNLGGKRGPLGSLCLPCLKWNTVWSC